MNYPTFEIISIIGTVITIYLALKIYNNFDVRKSFLQEQLKVVCELSNECYRFSLRTYYHPDVVLKYPLFLDFFNRQEIEGYDKIYFTTHKVVELFPFIKFRQNILLPKSIADVIRKFDVKMTDIDSESMPDKYILLMQGQDNIKNVPHYYFYNYYMRYNEFHELTKELIKAIEDWLGKYIPKDINFP